MILNLNNYKTLTVALASISLVLFAAACGGSTDESDRSESLRVIASMYPLEYFAERVGGDRVDVDGVVPAGGDAHDFEPTPGDLRNIAGADVIIYNGLGFESWVDALLGAGDAPDTAVQVSSEELALHFETNEIKLGPGVDGVHETEDLDPHLWLDPVLAVTKVLAITDGFIASDPEGELLYNSNSDALVAELVALDVQFSDALSTCSRDVFVTSHDSFNYLANRYDKDAVGISGINPESEPSPKSLANLSDAVTEAGIPYVLVSPIDSERLSDTLMRETGIQALPLHSLQNLTKDQRDAGETYFSLMETNLESLQTALGCSE